MELVENKQKKYEKVIYVSHPFSGDDANVTNIEYKILGLRNMFPNYLFISPVHTFGFLYNYTSYEEGIDMCLRLMQMCDEVWIVSKDYTDSKGCLIERSYAHSLGIPVMNMER